MVFNSIAIIGSGNVATNLAHNLAQLDTFQLGIYSPAIQHRTELALATKSILYHSIEETFEADIILICVPDNAIQNVVDLLPTNQKIAYTSGSIPLSTFVKHTNIGVFYPLQTFTKNHLINLKTVPFFVEANNQQLEKELFDFASLVGKNVSITSPEERKHYHLAAVLLNNFTNHLAHLAQQHLVEHELDWQNLLPLFEETARKITTSSPMEIQTGPARRNDTQVINQHLKELNENEKNIYLAMTNSIIKTYHD
jgi:predicted short-subunit dehydrogenase-like oxidoreductase (DUF2520 family)